LSNFDTAIRALDYFLEYPSIHTTDKGKIVYGDTKAQLKFGLVDIYGTPFTGNKKTTIYLVDAKN
jgi:hypothetical protein